jgi:hypothetical protein
MMSETSSKHQQGGLFFAFAQNDQMHFCIYKPAFSLALFAVFYRSRLLLRYIHSVVLLPPELSLR